MDVKDVKDVEVLDDVKPVTDVKPPDFTVHDPNFLPLAPQHPGLVYQRMPDPGLPPQPGHYQYSQPQDIHSQSHSDIRVNQYQNGGSSSPASQASQQQHPQVAARVPLPQLNPPPQPSAATGPMSSKVVVPPRPKPGRKPIPQDDAADRRRLQNRIAQRAFRDKRQQKLYETQLELEERKQEYQTTVSRLQRQLEEARQERRTQIAELTTHLNTERRRADVAERQLQVQSQFYPNSGSEGYVQGSVHNSMVRNGSHRGHMAAFDGSIVMTPPDEEIDFTNWRGASNQQHTPQDIPTSSGRHSMEFSDMETDERCGFCTDDQNCACRDRAEAGMSNARNNSTVMPAFTAGGCDACRSDPERAQACRDLAAATRPSNLEGSSLYGVTPPQQTMSCATLVDRLGQQGQQTSSVSAIFGGQNMMRAWPTAGGGYEVEEQEAALVLQSLGRFNSPVE